MALKRLTKAQTLVKYQLSDAYRLREEAHWAFMDGRVATAKEYNRRAGILETEARELRAISRFEAAPSQDHTVQLRNQLRADVDEYRRSLGLDGEASNG